MKKTQRTEAVRNIRRNLVSFLSIVIIAMLAVTAYLGIRFSADGILRSADATYEAEKFADIEIAAPMPFTAENLETVRGTEGVTDAEGILYVPSRAANGEKSRDIVIRTVSERISLPHLLSGGRLPQAEGECAVEKKLADELGYRIGDRVELTGRSPQTDMVISTKTYTVTGVFTIGDHLTDMVPFEPMVLVTRDAFSRTLLPENRYTRLLVRIDPADPYRFSKAWKDSADQAVSRLKEHDGTWAVMPLHLSSAYVCTDADAGLLSTVSVTFSMLFVVIAALVIYSTIGRLIEYDSRLVGAEKAMGVKNSEIFAKYLMFGTGGTAAGAAAGILIAYFAFECFVLFCFASVFMFGEWRMAFGTAEVLIVAAGAVLLSVLSVFLACRRQMKSTAVSLMTGQNHLRGGRKKARSGSGALYIRLMFRNMRTDLKRVFVSIVSIAGCCMLLMIGFSLKYAISRVPDRQYGVIQHFSMEIALDPLAGEESGNRIRAVLDGEGLRHQGVYSAETIYNAGGETGMLTLYCPGEDGNFTDCFSLRRNRKEQAVPESGLLVSASFARHYGLKSGDSITLYDGGNTAHEAKVSGTFENHAGIVAVCSREYAEQCFGAQVPVNTLLILDEVKDPDALRGKLSGTDGFVSLSSSRKQQEMFDTMSLMLNLVIVLLTGLALMIAAFILLNLVSTYVSQKKNELTIMRINGYTSGETIRYASMECYGITAAGILLGLGAGYLFSLYLVGRIEQLAMSFVKNPVWISFAASAGITAAISAIIHTIAFRKIRSLKLSDIKQ